jgi:hypothetical protein
MKSPSTDVKSFSDLDKVYNMIFELSQDLNHDFINVTLLSESVFNGLYTGITNDELFSLASETAAYMSTEHTDYSKLAARIAIKNLHTITKSSFSQTIEYIYCHVDEKTGLNTTNLSFRLYKIVKENADRIDSEINPARDFDFDYFGIKTLEK